MSNYNSIALKSILQKEDIFNILEYLKAHGISIDNNGLRSSCPIHGSKSSSVFVYNTDTHLYHCYGECIPGEESGDIITLVKNVEKCSYPNAIEIICDICNIDVNKIKDSEEWLLDQLNITLDNLLLDKKDIELELEYGVEPLNEEYASKFIGQKDEEGYIDGLGIGDDILTLFESGYNPKEKRWLLPIRSPYGELLGFDGRDITNKSKNKWKKRADLITSRLLGRLDIVKEEIEKENKIILVEGKKDQICIYEAGLKFVSCIYGSSLSKYQKELIDNMVSDEIIIFPDADKAGYKMVNNIVKLAYPEYNITVCETPDDLDPADLSIKHILELYENRINVEEWLKKYEYRK